MNVIGRLLDFFRNPHFVRVREEWLASSAAYLGYVGIATSDSTMKSNKRRSFERNLLALWLGLLSVYPVANFAALPPVIDMYVDSNTALEESPAPLLARHNREEGTLQQLETRIAQLEHTVASLVPLLAEVQALSQQLKTLQATLVKQKKILQQKPVRSNPVARPAPSSATVSTRRVSASTVSVGKPSEAAWQSALRLLEKKQYGAAIQAFEGFLKRYPTHAHRASAQYRLGQLALLQGSPNRAMRYFETLMREKPQGIRIPDVQLHIGLAHYAQGEDKTAIAIFRQLRQQYPNSQAAQTASQQLQRLKVIFE